MLTTRDATDAPRIVAEVLELVPVVVDAGRVWQYSESHIPSNQCINELRMNFMKGSYINGECNNM